MNVAVSANQIADWCVGYWENKCDPSKVNNCKRHTAGKYRDFLAATECPDFAIIRDVAETHKHLQIDRDSRTVSVATQTVGGSLGWGEGGWGEGGWGGGPQIVINLDNGQRRAFSAPMENVFNMWDRLLNAWRL